MYVGRIVAVGKTREDRLVVMYRVSSRSFPNRQTKIHGESVAIIPKKGFEADVFKNPYIAYNCLRVSGRYAVVGNGNHTDPITEKLITGMEMRDAIVSVLHGMDYEHDSYNTPRITAVANLGSKSCTLGIVRQDALLVETIHLARGEARYIATYEHNFLSKAFVDQNFQVTSAEEACDYVLGQGIFARLERPVSATSAYETEAGFFIKSKDVENDVPK